MGSLVGELHSAASRELKALGAVLDGQGWEAQAVAVLDKYRVLRAHEVELAGAEAALVSRVRARVGGLL